jgi:hypothetical protein
MFIAEAAETALTCCCCCCGGGGGCDSFSMTGAAKKGVDGLGFGGTAGGGLGGFGVETAAVDGNPITTLVP